MKVNNHLGLRERLRTLHTVTLIIVLHKRLTLSVAAHFSDLHTAADLKLASLTLNPHSISATSAKVEQREKRKTKIEVLTLLWAGKQNLGGKQLPAFLILTDADEVPVQKKPTVFFYHILMVPYSLGTVNVC